MHEVLVNRLGGLSLPRKSVVRLTDRPDMTLDVYRGRKTTIQQSLICGINGLSNLCAAHDPLLLTKAGITPSKHTQFYSHPEKILEKVQPFANE